MGESSRIDLVSKVVIVTLIVAVVGTAGYFGWTVYSDRVLAERSSPAGRIIAVLRDQIKAEPNDAALRVRLGEALSAIGRDEEAIEQFNAALTIDPEHTGALIDLGHLAVRNKRMTEADGYFRQVIELTEGSEFEAASDRREIALYQLGVISVSQRRYEDAIGYLKAALRIRKDASDSYYFLALAMDGIEDTEGAIRQLEIAVAFDPNFGQAQYYLGQLHSRAGDEVKAAEHFAAAVKADPDALEPKEALEQFGSVSELLAQARQLQAGQPAQALERAMIANYVAPKDPAAALLKAELLEETDEPKAALDAYRAALKLSPESQPIQAAIERLQDSTDKAAE